MGFRPRATCFWPRIWVENHINEKNLSPFCSCVYRPLPLRFIYFQCKRFHALPVGFFPLRRFRCPAGSGTTGERLSATIELLDFRFRFFFFSPFIPSLFLETRINNSRSVSKYLGSRRVLSRESLRNTCSFPFAVVARRPGVINSRSPALFRLWFAPLHGCHIYIKIPRRESRGKFQSKTEGIFPAFHFRVQFGHALSSFSRGGIAWIAQRDG